MYIYKVPSLINQDNVTFQLKQLIQNFPLNSKNVQITANTIGMDLESNTFVSSADAQSVVVYNKIVLWKINGKNPNDLPNISLTDMRQYLFDYFKSSITFDHISNSTTLGNLFIGLGNFSSKVEFKTRQI